MQIRFVMHVILSFTLLDAMIRGDDEDCFIFFSRKIARKIGQRVTLLMRLLSVKDTGFHNRREIWSSLGDDRHILLRLEIDFCSNRFRMTNNNDKIWKEDLRRHSIVDNLYCLHKAVIESESCINCRARDLHYQYITKSTPIGGNRKWTGPSTPF